MLFRCRIEKRLFDKANRVTKRAGHVHLSLKGSSPVVDGNHRSHQGGLPRLRDVSLVLRQVASHGGVNQIALAKHWPVQAIRFAQKVTGKINRAEATPQSTRCNHGQLFKCWANAVGRVG